MLRAERHDAVQGLLADRQDLALESALVRQGRVGGDDRLADCRHGLDDALAEPGRVDRHVAPADQRLALRPNKMLDMTDREIARRRVARQKAHRDGVMPEIG